MDRLLNVAILDALEYDMNETLRLYTPTSDEVWEDEDDVASIDSEIEHLASWTDLIHEEIQELDSSWGRRDKRGNLKLPADVENSCGEGCASAMSSCHRGASDISVTDVTDDTADESDIQSSDDASVVLDSLQWDDFIVHSENGALQASDTSHLVDGSAYVVSSLSKEFSPSALTLPEFPWLVPRTPTTVCTRSLAIAGDILASQWRAASHPNILASWLDKQLKSPKLLPQDYYQYLPVVGSFRSSGSFPMLRKKHPVERT